jgi:hypothetical protein
MSRILKVSAIALLSLFFIVLPASAQFRRGFYGPGWGWGGWYGPGWYGPYGYWGYPYGYGYGYGYAPDPRAGEVKFVDVAKDAMVYVDGGYAGTAGKLKKFPLRPGNHDIELRDPSGHTFHQEKINVLPGKTLEIHGTTGGH